MPEIFVSYRRDDSAGHAGRIYDRLSNHFGKEKLFRDVDHLRYGEDFVEALDEAVGSCKALIAVIGPNWLTAEDKRGKRRLDSPTDFVRIEIESALSREVSVFPVLVNSAEMPDPEELPKSISGLARRQGLEISEIRFDYDVAELIKGLERRVNGDTEDLSGKEAEDSDSEVEVNTEPVSTIDDSVASRTTRQGLGGAGFLTEIGLNIVFFTVIGFWLSGQFTGNIIFPIDGGYVTTLPTVTKHVIGLVIATFGVFTSLVTNRIIRVRYWDGVVFCLLSFAVLGAGFMFWLKTKGATQGSELDLVIPLWIFGALITIWKITKTIFGRRIFGFQ
jgi:hypothetical protein